MTRILLLDSSSLIYRAYFAMERTPLTDSNGNPTAAVYGYLNMLFKLINDLKPTHAVAAFDVKAPTIRKKEYEGYKATRSPMPDDLVQQLPILREALTAMGIKIIEKEGYEADDIIGTVAKVFDVDTCIITGDKDSLQLIDHNTFVYRTMKGVTDLLKYDKSMLLEKEGLLPYQIIEYKALAGDASDNIPGCKGIGEKTAKDLLQQYDNVENIYKHLDELKPAAKRNLIECRDNVLMSKKLATIYTDVDLGISLDDLLFKPSIYQYKEFCKKYNFRTLIAKGEKLFGGDIIDEEVLIDNDIKIEKVNITLKDLNELLKKESGDLAFYVGEDIHISFSKEKEYIITLPKTLFDFGDSENIEDIIPIVFASKNKKILFNTKSLFHIADNIVLNLEDFDDVQLMAYLINSSQNCQTVESVLEHYQLDVTCPAASMLYLKNRFSKTIDKDNLKKLYEEIEKPLIYVLYDMEKQGFTIDYQALLDARVRLNADIKVLLDKIYGIAGETFNVNSTKQLGSILFEKLGLNSGKKNKTGLSVAADVLESIDHPIIPLILEYRHKQKLLSTYIDGMESVMNKSTGKVHSIFKQCLTVTGRLSSTEPNLQNIPVRDDEGKEIRKMFVASQGNMLVGADYSQIELRLLAHFSNDSNLVSAYKGGRDIHKETASLIFNIPLEDVTSKERTAAKAVNFGIVYGISGFGLANNIGITPKEARDFQKKYFETFPRVEEYMKSNVEKAYKDGCISTLMGRIRRLQELSSNNYNLRSFGERAAMNMPLQGTASDIIKIAMLNVHKALKDNGLKAKLILQVHDELIVDSPIDEVDEVKEILKTEMENAVKLNVPLPVEVGVGKSWYESK